MDSELCSAVGSRRRRGGVARIGRRRNVGVSGAVIGALLPLVGRRRVARGNLREGGGLRRNRRGLRGMGRDRRGRHGGCDREKGRSTVDDGGRIADHRAQFGSFWDGRSLGRGLEIYFWNLGIR